MTSAGSDSAGPLDQGVHAELAVVVLHPRDAEAAREGGADRLLLAARNGDGFAGVDTPAISAVSRVGGAEVWPLVEPANPRTAHAAVEVGAHGLVFGFLDRDLRVDRIGCAEVVAETGAPWLFWGLDRALEADRAWTEVAGLPGLDGVLTAGSLRGLSHGSEDLIDRATADPGAARLVVAGGGLRAEQVPWLVRAGVRRFAVGSSARAGGSWTRGSVTPEAVRTWRNLIDDALDRARGVEPG